MLLWDNCSLKWQETLDWMEKNPNKKPVQRSKKTKAMKQFQAKFTSQDGGQKPLGGWSSTGINRFNEIYDLVGAAKFEGYGTPQQAAKPKDTWTALEEDFLTRLRTELGIEASDA